MIRVGFSNIFRIAQAQSKTATNYRVANDIPDSVPREHMNLYQAVNSAIDVALETDKT